MTASSYQHVHETSKPLAEIIEFSCGRLLTLGHFHNLILSPKQWADLSLRMTLALTSWEAFEDAFSVLNTKLASKEEAGAARVVDARGFQLNISDSEELQDTVSTYVLDLEKTLSSQSEFESTYLLLQRIMADQLHVNKSPPVHTLCS
jgi:hypothetical protein